MRGTEEEIRAFDRWLATQPHPHKIVVAGNHDFAFEDVADAADWITGAIYLQDEGVEIGGLRIWGSPWQPWFHDWAFQRDRGSPMAQVWAAIPTDTDVLVTHGPPHGILDRTSREVDAGCEALLAALERVQPRLHVFGHIHEAYGQLQRGDTRFVNASTCDLRYQPVHPPIVVEI